MSSRRFQGIRHVQPGSGITASNTSQSTRELEARTNLLRDQLDGVSAGMLLQWESRAVSTDVIEGNAVFWNITNSRFEPSLAGAENDTATGTYVPTASSDVLGVCLHKEDSTTGTIIFAGFAEMTPAQVTNLFGASATPGRYYLSASVAGRLTKQRPAVTIAVAYLLGPSTACDVNSWVYILPQHRNFLEDHVHYQLELAAVPSGDHTPPTIGESHVITNADTAIRGWLPADDASFSGMAPAGAAFGYNIAADTALSTVWPPLPTASALLEILRPATVDAEEISGFVRVPDNFVRVDLHGIWWMTDCYNQVPWDTAYDNVTVESSSSATADCPVAPPVRLILSFVKMTALTDKTVVTSLQPVSGEPIEFLDVNGVVATTGDLYAKLNLALLIEEAETLGGQVLKGVTESGSQFTQGWVAEGIISGSESLTITSTHSRLQDPDSAADDTTNREVHQGIITIDFAADGGDKELQPQLVKLSDTLEREHKGVLYLGFPTGRTSSAKFSIVVPDSGLPTGDLQMHIKTLVFGRTNGPLPTITMTQYRLEKPAENVPFSIVASDTNVTYDVNGPSSDTDGLGTDLVVDDVIEVLSDTFEIATGDTVFITISRASDATPAFAADFGLIRVIGVVSRVP